MTSHDAITVLLQQAPPDRRDDLVALSVLELVAVDPAWVVPETLLAIVQQFLNRTGIGRGADAAALWREIHAYLDLHPLDAKLVTALRQELRRAAAELDPHTRTALAFLGRDTPHALPAAPAPADAIRADPFARFRVGKPGTK